MLDHRPENHEGPRIAPLEARHIRGVVNVHMRAFPRFFLTFLGPRFLREFYRSFLIDPTGVAYVSEDPGTGEAVGVIAGPVTPAGWFRRLLKRRWWVFCLASARAALRRPRIIPRLVRALFYRADAPPGVERALLSSIAVDPLAQSRGIGRGLVAAWVAEVRRRGARGAYLTTDAVDNDAVERFYRNLGWRVESTYTTRQGRRMKRYVLDFAAGTVEGDHE